MDFEEMRSSNGSVSPLNEDIINYNYEKITQQILRSARTYSNRFPRLSQLPV